MSDHRCERPAEAHANGQPWRCPECGLLWEAFPAPPAAQPRRKIFTRDRVIIAGLGVVGGACVAAQAISETALAVMGVLVALGTLAWVVVSSLRTRETIDGEHASKHAPDSQ